MIKRYDETRAYRHILPAGRKVHPPSPPPFPTARGPRRRATPGYSAPRERGWLLRGMGSQNLPAPRNTPILPSFPLTKRVCSVPAPQVFTHTPEKAENLWEIRAPTDTPRKVRAGSDGAPGAGSTTRSPFGITSPRTDMPASKAAWAACVHPRGAPERPEFLARTGTGADSCLLQSRQ